MTGKVLQFGAPKGGWPSFNKEGKRVSRLAYLAGPMRGYDQSNFPAFDRGAEWLRKQGWEILSPAEHERSVGYDEKTQTYANGKPWDIRASFTWDVNAVLRADAIILLPGWEKSIGVTQAELPVARTIGLEVYEIPCLKNPELVALTDEQIQQALDYAPNSAYQRGYEVGYEPCDC